MRRAGLGLAALLLITGCSREPAAESDGGGSGPAASGEGTSLSVDVSDGKHSVSFTVTCDPAGGTHPHPQSACDFLALAHKWGQDPFAPVPADQACAQVYGGPLTATVTGTWLGKPVDATFSRTDSCQTDRWNNAVALLAVQQDLTPDPRPSAS